MRWFARSGENVPDFSDVSVTGVSFGARVRLVAPSNLYGCSLGDDVFVGPFVEIQSGVKIGNRTKIQSHTFVCEMVSVGEDCFIGHSVVFVNDFLRTGPAGGDREKWAPTFLGNRVLVGSNATILPVIIGDDVLIGAGAVVTKDLLDSGVYVGNPARRIR